MEPKLIVVGIDVHKKMLSVVVVDENHPQQAREQRKFASNGSDLKHLAAWLDSHGVSLVVMESTALYWRPDGWRWRANMRCIWRRHNPMRPRVSGNRTTSRPCDWRGGFLQRSCRLSFVPDAEQRTWRCVSRNKHQKRQRRIPIQNQIEALLEERQIKLLSVITDLLGVTGFRILKALARDSKPLSLLDVQPRTLAVEQVCRICRLLGGSRMPWLSSPWWKWQFLW
jgi:transposase